MEHREINSMGSEVLISAQNVSKKFCKSLKRSLWYALCDIARGLNPFSSRNRSQESMEAPPPSLRKSEFWAVEGVSFELRRGECLGLIGHNGAGKSTLLKVLNGLLPPDHGSIRMKGRVAALIELNAGFNPILTGRENIYNQAALLGFSKTETDARFDAIAEFSEIGDFLDTPVQNYSSGMKVRLGFAIAAQMEPDILIIDEVLAVGDVAFRAKCINAIGEIMKTAAVVFVTHTMPQVFRICTDVIVLDHGRITCHSSNVQEAVGVYLELFKGGGRMTAGSGEAVVGGVRLASAGVTAESGETLVCNHAAELIIEADIELSDPISEARVQFLFWNSELLPAMDVLADDLSGFSVKRGKSGQISVKAAVPRVELGPGKYSISVIVLLPDLTRVLCRQDNSAFMRVAAASGSGAQTLCVAKWSCSEKAPA